MAESLPISQACTPNVFLGTVISGKVKWGGMTEEVLWGQESQLFQTNSQQLFFFLFSAGRKRRNGLHRHLFRHAQQEEWLWDGWFGRGDNKTASLQPPLRLGPVYSWMTVLGPQWKCASQTTPDKCSVWLLAAQTNPDPICHSSADWSPLKLLVHYCLL